MKTYLVPTRDQFKQLMGMGDRGPIFMLNLLRFKPGDGAETYRRYGEAGAPVFRRIGVEIVFQGPMVMPVIGEETWDEVLIARDPSISAFIEMNRDPDYQQAATIREAALMDSRLYMILADPA
ncbi:MAG: DUF1330 domain-containing protein [Proteobacteria bacterium]|nr:DUF1330 domain-containing protein [Pseudomonadota bacterium]